MGYLNKLKEHLGIILLYLLLTLILTYPLVFFFNTHLAGDGGDSWVFIWNFWWIKKAIVELRQNPYYTDFLFYPYGHTLVFHCFSPFNGLLSIPLRSFFNLYATYNSIFVFSFVMSGFGMYLLVHYLTNNKICSFIGGFIFAFCPAHMGHALGHLHIMATEWIPFYILYFLKTQRDYNLKNMLLAVLFLILSAGCSWYHLMSCLIFSGLYILYFCIKEKTPLLIIKKSTGVFFLTVYILLPVFIVMIKEIMQHDFIGQHNPEEWSADIMSFFIPGEIQSFGRFFTPITSRFTGNTAENSNYLGCVVIFLSIFAIIKLWKRDKYVPFLTFSAFIFFILSLGTHLHVFGRVTKMPLPFLFLSKFVPFFSFSGVPERFHVMTMLCLAILSSFAVREILASKRKAKGTILVICLSSLLVLEFLAAPFPVSSFPLTSFKGGKRSAPEAFHPIPGFYTTIANDTGDYGILDVEAGPIYSERRLEVHYYQTIHNKKILRGNIARSHRRYDDFLTNTPGIASILMNREVFFNQGWHYELVRKTVENTFKHYKIKYVIVPAPGDDYPENYIVEFYGFNKVYEDNKIRAYLVYDEK